MAFPMGLFGELNIQLVLVFGVVLLLAYWLLQQRETRPLPPGPLSLPIVGSLPAIIYKLRQLQYSRKVFLEWQKQYGDIFSIRMGSQIAVVINGYKYVNEVFREKGEYINKRPSIYIADEFFKGDGVIMSNGQKWQDMRRFSLRSMRDFGLGKKSLEERIQDEARIFMETWASDKQPFSQRDVLLKTVCNIICGICFGQRFLKQLDTIVRTAGFQVPENFFPWLRHVPLISKIHVIRKCNEDMIADVAQTMKEHEETFDENNIRDFMDLHIQMKRSGDHKETLTDEHVFRAIIDLFIAGTETTASSLGWLLAFMLRYPDVQTKCQQEIDRVVGSGRMVSLSDKAELKFTMAVVYEVQRLASILTLGVPRAVTEDFELGGYLLPKDAMVMLHLHSVHHDDTYWEDADDFRPERWINENGTLKKFDGFMPFGLGPRQCLGESLANMEMFLFFTNLLQSCTLKVPPGTSPPSLEGVQPGFINLPGEYCLLAEKRQ